MTEEPIEVITELPEIDGEELVDPQETPRAEQEWQEVTAWVEEACEKMPEEPVATDGLSADAWREGDCR